MSKHPERGYDNPHCAGCERDVKRMREYAYMVHKRIWKSAMQRYRRQGGKQSTYDLLCIGCLETRLGRMLTSADFDWAVPLTYNPTYRRSRRLESRLGYERLARLQEKWWDDHKHLMR